MLPDVLSTITKRPLRGFCTCDSALPAIDFEVELEREACKVADAFLATLEFLLSLFFVGLCEATAFFLLRPLVDADLVDLRATLNLPVWI